MPDPRAARRRVLPVVLDGGDGAGTQARAREVSVVPVLGRLSWPLWLDDREELLMSRSLCASLRRYAQTWTGLGMCAGLPWVRLLKLRVGRLYIHVAWKRGQE